MDAKVGFLIIGVQKGGTTSMDAVLRQHPHLCLAKTKEVHFFDDDAAFAAGADFAGYHAQFDAPPRARLLGESTPIYIYWPGALRRIRAYNPGMRLIVLLRDPAQRAWSHWRMESGRGDDSLDFSTAIRTEAARVRAAGTPKHRHYSYLDRGLYAPQIEAVWGLFPLEQALFLKSEEFSARPAETLGRVCAFLGVDPFPFDTGARHFVGPKSGAPPAADREFMADFFREDIVRTAGLLSWDCGHWCKEWE